MNCCNPMTGQCTQGDDCCARESCAPEGATPEQLRHERLQRAMDAAVVKYTADLPVTMYECDRDRRTCPERTESESLWAWAVALVIGAAVLAAVLV